MDGSKLKEAQAALAEAPGYHIRDKKHVAVKDRVEIFRRFFPGYGISTRMEKHGTNLGSAIVVRAAISDDTGREVASGYSEVVRGDGTVGTSAPVELAETKAIGRAVACLGLSGGEYASADELAAMAVQGNSSGFDLPTDGVPRNTTPPDHSLPGSISGYQESSQSITQVRSLAPIRDLELDAACGAQPIEMAPGGVPDGEGDGGSGAHPNRAWGEILKVLRVGITLQQSAAELTSYYDQNKQLIYELKKFDKGLWNELMDEFKKAKSNLPSNEELSI